MAYATLTFIDADGGYKVEPPAPEGAEQVMVVGDPETMADGVAGLVEMLRETGDADEGDRHALTFYTWSDEVWSFDAENRKFTRGAA